MGKFIYDFGDGSRNSVIHSYGTSSSNPIYWITETNTETMYNASAPNYGGDNWGSRDSGNAWTNLLTSLGNKISIATYSTNFSGNATRVASFTLDSSLEYIFYANGYTDENDECNFGSIYVNVNGTYYTLQQCIDNGFIKPLVFISRALTDHSSKNNGLSALLNGGNSATEVYGTNLFWRFMFITNAGYNITSVKFYYHGVESGSWKIGSTKDNGFPCLGFSEKPNTIYKGATNLESIIFGTKNILGVFYRGYQLWYGGELPTPIEYDFQIDTEYNEVDFLYTTDTHLAWKNSGNSNYAVSQMFTPNDVANYKDKLWDNGIPTFCLDCGDFIHGVGNQESVRDIIINLFNSCGSKGYTKYLAVTFGNHEWYASMGSTSTIINYLNRVNNMTACNLLLNGETVYKPYRAIKIGSKKIGIIGVGYPSPNGRDGTTNSVRTFDGYTFYDGERTTSLNPSSALYAQVQKYINMFKKKNFDYIIAIAHMDKYSDENFNDDTRFNARADSLIKNTQGLDVVIPGHYNYPITSTYTFTGLDGKSGLIVQEAGASLNSFGRLRFVFNDSTPIKSYLLDSLDDLEVI